MTGFDLSKKEVLLERLERKRMENALAGAMERLTIRLLLWLALFGGMVALNALMGGK